MSHTFLDHLSWELALGGLNMIQTAHQKQQKKVFYHHTDQLKSQVFKNIVARAGDSGAWKSPSNN